MCAGRTASSPLVVPTTSTLFRGAFVGAVAWVAGFLATFAVTFVQFSPYLRYSPAEFSLADTAWFALSSYPSYHLSTLLGGSLGVSVGLAALLVATPVVVALVAGAAAADVSRGEPAVAGASVAIGYFAVHLGVVFVLAGAGNGPLGTVDPASVTAVVSNGLLQPAALGALGGVAVR